MIDRHLGGSLAAHENNCGTLISKEEAAAAKLRCETKRWERVCGHALKDWATALMNNRGVTRAEARKQILGIIAAETCNEQALSVANAEARAARLLDHLPEGSH